MLATVLFMVSCDKEPQTGFLENDLVRNQSTDIFIQWNQLFLELDQIAFGMRPNATARAIAYTNLAAYEALVPGMPGLRTVSNNFEELQISMSLLPSEINWNLVLNNTYAQVLNHFMYGVSSLSKLSISELQNQINIELESTLSDDIVINSKAWARYVASRIINFSLTDGSAEEQILEPQPLSYEPPVGEGFWTYSDDAERALFPYWGNIRTFVIAPEETTSIPPISYSIEENSDFYKEMMDVYLENNQAKTDMELLWIAEFWSDDVEGLMISPPGRQVSIAVQLVEQFDLNLEESIELFLRLGFSLNDAAVSTWKYKYQYLLMRPSEYIREYIDPDYQTNLFRLVFWPNPSFPGYPSGHSCFASAAAGIFIDKFGNNINFTDRTHENATEFIGTPRSFNSFENLAFENAYSRIPLGVHIADDCKEGLRLGYEISDAVNKLNLR